MSNIFHHWHYKATTSEQHIVFPDGCRDVLIIQTPDKPAQVIMTHFDLQPRAVNFVSGTEILGYRLRPGLVVSEHVLEAISENNGQTEHILNDQCTAWGDLDDAIKALTEFSTTVESVSRQIGVSVRTLQRHFLSSRLPTPDYWRLLARARRAARLLSSSVTLVVIADECGLAIKHI